MQGLFWGIGSMMSLAAAQQVCNGYSEYCSQRYSQLSYTGSHDSAFIRTSAENSLFGNQFYSVTTQLNSGVRMLQSQVHSSDTTNSSSGIELCHTACNYPGSDFGPLETYLTDVKNWLDANPNEVITILWVNGGFDPTVWQQAYTSTGLLQYVYTPSVTTQGILTLNDWPTLGELISANTRVINFMDAGANFASVPWLLDEFSNVWETSYDVTNAAEFQCTLDRPYASQYQSSIASSQKLYLINHFLDYELGNTGIDIPNVTYASVTNSVSDRVGSLSSQVTNCTTLNGRKPNFFLVDFFDQGNGSSVAAAAIANGVQYRPSTLFPGPFNVPGSENYTSSYAAGSNSTSAASSAASSSSSASSTRAPGAVVSGGGPRTLPDGSSTTNSPSSSTAGASQTMNSMASSASSTGSSLTPSSTSSSATTKSNATLSTSSSAFGLILTTILSTLATTTASGASITSPVTKTTTENKGSNLSSQSTSSSPLILATSTSGSNAILSTLSLIKTTTGTNSQSSQGASTSTSGANAVNTPSVSGIITSTSTTATASPRLTTLVGPVVVGGSTATATAIVPVPTTNVPSSSTTNLAAVAIPVTTVTTSRVGTALIGALFFSSTSTSPIAPLQTSVVVARTSPLVTSASTLATSITTSPSTIITSRSSTVVNAVTSTALPRSTSGTSKTMASSSSLLLGTISILSWYMLL